MITIRVYGTPAPQGSKSAFQHKTTGRVVVTEQGHKKVQSWREDVKAAARRAMDDTDWTSLDEPVLVQINFTIARPAYHYGTGRNAGVLKASAPVWVTAKPDLDKTIRSTLDALTAVGIYRDDSRVASIIATKRYDDGPVGALITVQAVST